MMVMVTPVLDRSVLLNFQPSLQKQQDSFWKKTLECCFQRVLKGKGISYVLDKWNLLPERWQW